jgi:uncharacterized metal-binding protein YceD (DUF177 family)
MIESEFPRPYDVRFLPAEPVTLTASAEECAALAQRFALPAVHALHATVTLLADGATVTVRGRLVARVVQSCAISGEDLPQALDEPVQLRFVPEGAAATPGEEVEISADDCDEIDYSGTQFDLGEALAQSLAIALDPFAAGPNAEEARRVAGLVDQQAAGPFAALAALKRND